MAKKYKQSITFVDDVSQNFPRFRDAFRDELQKYLEENAKELENYMKQNAPWKNHTYNARRGLSATINHNKYRRFTLTLSHGVKYGVFLELCNEQRFAIIIPTLSQKSHSILYHLNAFIKRRVKFYAKKSKGR